MKEVDLTALHDAIVDDIKAAFPALKTVQFYPGEDEPDTLRKMPKPACLLELTEFEPGEDDPGTEEQAVIATFEMRLIIGFRTERAQHSIRQQVAAMVAWLRHRRWSDKGNPGKNIPMGPAMLIGAYPDDFRTQGQKREGDLDQYQVWRIEWRQEMNLGTNFWLDEGSTPDCPLYSWAPRIGIGHEQDYAPVARAVPVKPVFVVNELAISLPDKGEA